MISLRLEDPEGVVLSGTHDLDHQDSPDLLVGLSGWSGGVGTTRTNLDRLTHGSFPTPTRRTGRTITVDLMLERDTRQELWALERGISGLFADGGYGTLTVRNDSEELSASVTLDGEVKPTVYLDGGHITAQIPLWAPEPYLYSPWRETTLRPASDGVGIQFPLFATMTGEDILLYGEEVASDAYVWNDGNAESYPVVEVRADSAGGFRLTCGDGYVVWPRPTYADVPVVVDFSGTISVGGSRQTHFSQERSWAGVKPSSIALPTFELLQGGTGYATVRHRDTSI